MSAELSISEDLDLNSVAAVNLPPDEEEETKNAVEISRVAPSVEMIAETTLPSTGTDYGGGDLFDEHVIAAAVAAERPQVDLKSVELDSAQITELVRGLKDGTSEAEITSSHVVAVEGEGIEFNGVDQDAVAPGERSITRGGDYTETACNHLGFDDMLSSHSSHTSQHRMRSDRVHAELQPTVTSGAQYTDPCAVHNGTRIGYPLITTYTRTSEQGTSLSHVQPTQSNCSIEDAVQGVQVQDILGGEVAGAANGVGLETRGEVSEMSISDDYHTFMEKTSSEESEVLDGSIFKQYRKEDVGGKEGTCLMHLEQKTLFQLSKPVSNRVKESLNEEIHILMSSTSHSREKPDSLLAAVSVPHTTNMNERIETRVTKGSALEDEKKQAGIEVVMEKQLNVLSELVSEEVQVGGENGVENSQVLEMNNGVVGTDALDWKPFYSDGKQMLEAEAVGVGSGYLPDGASVIQNGMSAEDSNSCPKAFNGAQAADTCAFQHGEIETLVVREAEYFGNVNPDSEFPVTKDCNSSIHVYKNSDTHVSAINTTEDRNKIIDVGSGKHQAGVSCQSAMNRIMTSHGSEDEALRCSRNEHIVNTSVEDLDSFRCTPGELKIQNEFIKDVHPPAWEPYDKVAKTNEVRDSLMSSLFDDSHEDSIEGVGEVEPVTTQNPPAGFDEGNSIDKQVLYQNALETETSSKRKHAATYTLEPKKEGVFSVSDLVWGKVKSHPWWPGQIFDISDASERALKYKRKGSFLIAYFGDQTFAWNDASSLSHFRLQFAHMEKQSPSEAFRIAVDYALDEVSRRVETGMMCSCTPKEVYEQVNYQVIQNAGIRKGVRRMGCLDKSLSAISFEPAKLLHYIKTLAQPCDEDDNRLELRIAEAHLLAFYRLKGYRRLPEYHVYGGFLEEGVDCSVCGEVDPSQSVIEHGIPVSKKDERMLSAKAKVAIRKRSSHRKYGSDGGPLPSRKRRSLSDKMVGKKAPLYLANNGKKAVDGRASSKSASSSGIKRKDVDSYSEDTTSKSMKLDTESRGPQSFKIGECIRRIASQLTGSPPILKCSNEKFQKIATKLDNGNENDETDDSPFIPGGSHSKRIVLLKEHSSPEEMLSQLCLVARDPLRGYSSVSNIVNFFSDFRNSISLEFSISGKQKRSEKVGGKTGIGSRKQFNAETSFNKTFDFEDMNDSYWTDRVIQSSPEEQPSGRSGMREGETHSGIYTELDTSSFEAEDHLQRSLVLDSEKQNIDDDYVPGKERKPSRKYRKRKGKSLIPVDNDEALDIQLASLGDYDLVTGKPARRQNEAKYVKEISPAALLMNFTDSGSIPSAMNLNKIFRRFGPLKESATEVLRDTSSASVVFKKQTDAEVALSSAAKFNIFGPQQVNYQIQSVIGRE